MRSLSAQLERIGIDDPVDSAQFVDSVSLKVSTAKIVAAI